MGNGEEDDRGRLTSPEKVDSANGGLRFSKVSKKYEKDRALLNRGEKQKTKQEKGPEGKYPICSPIKEKESVKSTVGTKAFTWGKKKIVLASIGFKNLTIGKKAGKGQGEKLN